MIAYIENLCHEIVSNIWQKKEVNLSGILPGYACRSQAVHTIVWPGGAPLLGPSTPPQSLCWISPTPLTRGNRWFLYKSRDRNPRLQDWRGLQTPSTHHWNAISSTEINLIQMCGLFCKMSVLFHIPFWFCSFIMYLPFTPRSSITVFKQFIDKLNTESDMMYILYVWVVNAVNIERIKPKQILHLYSN